jgi:CMP/dCMP kinase
MSGLNVVAIDGPAGSGKSTIAKALAVRLGVQHLDTGAMYRSVAWASLQRGVSLDDVAAMANVAESIDLVVGARIDGTQVVTVDGVDVTAAIRSPEIDAAVGPVASAAPVRAALVAQQRRWAEQHGGGVLEGRDIATVVFPDAAVKVYLTASVDERARRRSVQHGGEVASVAADIERRDLVDSTRKADPLQIAAGAHVVDTTGRTVDEVLDQIEVLVSAASTVKPATVPSATLPSATLSPAVSSMVRPTFPVPVLNRRERALYGTVHAAVKTLLSTYIPTKYVGLENVPKTGPFIVASVHRSVIDFMIVGLLTKRRLRYMGKDSVWNVKWFVPIADTLGGIPVSRGTIDRDSVNRCIEALTSGEPLVLFPEGRRKAGPVVEDLFDGVAFIALKAGVPILPVGIGGSDRVLPLGAKFPRRRRVLVKVGPVIESPFDSTTRSVRKAAPALTFRLRDEIQRLYDEAQREVR